ncbi:MAG: hypothetical protein CMJ39_07975 [Phycisphaerae bacterium]|nr:hypothetical protein [Phycisphaerae bacterium]
MDPKERYPRPDTNTPTIRLGNVDDGEFDLPPHLRLEPGDEVGHYKILSVVAEGGFGIVYLAEQYNPVRRRVALKIIKPGMDTRAVIARFEAERQALAILDHPAIATVYDAGATDDGRPFFVMEFVEGDPITQYADENRLNPSQRLVLMTKVCAAVQHAHMKGIIHRDLKPSNILVTTDDDGEPCPKVIDFGVAKATSIELTEQSFCTETGQLIGTPEYMSPEQADLGSADVDTRSDVYSLGMILYELMSGALPFESIAMRQAGFSELCRIIQEDEPPKPSTRLVSMGGEASKIATRRQSRPAELAAMLRRELDWIPLKALRKERDERYESANALAEDIKRYMDGDALVAGPETSGYRLRKFLRRNRGGVLAAAIVFVAMLIGLNISLLLLAKSKSAEQDARQEEANSERILAQLLENEDEYRRDLAKKDKSLDVLQQELNSTQQANIQLQRNNYKFFLISAATAIDAGDTQDARQLLLQAIDGRSHESAFEWHHLWAQAEPSLGSLQLPEEQDIRAVVAPDPTRLFTFSPQRFAIWDAGGRIDPVAPQPLTTIATPGQDPDEVIISPNGLTAIMGELNGERDVLELNTGRILAMLPASPGDTPDFRYSGDGRRFARFLDDTTIRVQTSNNARPVADITVPKGAQFYQLDHTGSRLATVDQQRVDLARISSTDSAIATLQHELDVTAIAFDRAAIRLVTATMDGGIHTWDIHTGRRNNSYLVPIRSIDSISFSPDGNLLHLHNSRDSDLIIDAETGDVIAEPGGAWTMAEDWSVIVSGKDPSRLLIQWLDGSRPERSLAVDAATATALSKDGNLLLTADHSGNIQLWDLSDSDSESVQLGHHDSPVSSVSFVDEGRRVLSVARDGTRLWPTHADGRIDQIDPSDCPPGMLRYTDDGKRLISGCGDGTILVIDLLSGRVLASLDAHAAEITSMELSHDGTRLVTAGRDNMIRLWDLTTGRKMREDERSWWSGDPNVLDPAAGHLIIAGQGNSLLLIDTKTGKQKALLSNHDAPVQSIEFDSSGNRMVTGDESGRIWLWDTAQGLGLREFPGHEAAVTQLSLKDNRLVSGSMDGTIRFWDVNRGQEMDDLKILVGDGIQLMAVSTEANLVAASMPDGSARAWTMSTGDRVASLGGDGSQISTLEFSGDGSLLMIQGEDGLLRTWDTTSWEPGADLPGSVANLINREVDEGMRRVATVQSGRSIQLHDARTGETIFTLRGHDQDINLMQFSPSGDQLVSIDSDGQMRIWNTVTIGHADAKRQLQHESWLKLEPRVLEWIKEADGDEQGLEQTIKVESTGLAPVDVQTVKDLLLLHGKASSIQSGL